MKKIIKIGTRSSNLAMWQTKSMADKLKQIAPEHEYQIVTFDTKGDQILDTALSKIGDKGLFTETLEIALLNSEIDLAVHSLKDMPTQLPPKLVLSGFSERHRPNDAWISKDNLSISELPVGAVVGTSSLRRIAQVKKIRPDIIIKDLRGNIETRLNKLKSGEYDAIILAAAGLERLNFNQEISSLLDTNLFIPAVGQGVVVAEYHEDNLLVKNLLEKITDQEAKIAVLAERAFLRTLEGGCQAPIGALATVENNIVCLSGFVSNLSGTKFLSVQGEAKGEDSEALGEKLARDLLAQGAKKIMNEEVK